jgi:CO dehydrogenase maturation factor
MKMLVCGKGGCGKSTITALLAKEIAGRGRKVLVIDTDESNIGLHNLLGIAKPNDFMNYFGGKKILIEKTKALKDTWKIDDLPTDHISEKGNIKLLSMGKIYEFGEGCACPINVLSSRFLEVLELANREFLIADTDAGIEHFGRGLERGVDILLAVVDPSQESILLARKISKLGDQVGKPVYCILNKVNHETEGFLSDSLGNEKVISAIPENKEIFISGLKGEELDLSLEGVKKIADKVLNEKH